jgi:hypothetical protein
LSNVEVFDRAPFSNVIEEGRPGVSLSFEGNHNPCKDKAVYTGKYRSGSSPFSSLLFGALDRAHQR